MRINGINKLNSVYKANKVCKAYDSLKAKDNKDVLDKSNVAKEMQVAKKAVENAPDIRETKVKKIKEKMEAGTYNVTAAQLADRLLNKINKE